jgi:phosphatidylserine/phosphatidylglycerophosphate/cardiolipin synthase-like enzyme
MKPTNPSTESGGLRAMAYAGDNKILLAMSLADAAINPTDKNLAGFAIWRTADGKERALSNRIVFQPAGAPTTQPRWTDSDQAPFQKFRWIDVPPDGFHGPLTYRIRALYFAGQNGTATKPGPEVTLTVTPAKQLHTHFRPAFTRGYIASQAYADKFKNKDIRPAGAKSLDFDIAPFEPQYKWLGADAREEVLDFLKTVEDDPDARLDVFAYDLDVPDLVKRICDIATTRRGKVRAVLDNAALHVPDKKKGKIPLEVEAAKRFKAALGADCVRQGHFSRYQHNKVLIRRDKAGDAQDVVFGSMNFSIRGIYVQANNVIRVTDPTVAGMFAKAFDVAFAGKVSTAAFTKDKISAGYMVGSAQDTKELPKFSLALSPHKDWKVSLGAMTDRIRAAGSSVLYAVMAPKGQGPVLTSLRTMAGVPTIFSYGTVETDKGLAVQSPDGAMGAITGYAALIKNVPAPFTEEFRDGLGMHIHNKFVVVDFNADNPTVFTGSSNLASGGEKQNGDSLAMIEDAAVANMYAVEAVALFDHYHYRKKAQAATKTWPLSLWYPGKPGMPDPWWKQYYDPSRIQMRDRYLFAGLPLPAGLAAKKDVDWASLDKEADKPKAKKAKAAKGKKAKAKKAKAPKGKKAKKAKAKKAKKVKAKKTKAKKTKAKKAKAKKTKRAKSRR